MCKTDESECLKKAGMNQRSKEVVQYILIMAALIPFRITEWLGKAACSRIGAMSGDKLISSLRLC